MAAASGARSRGSYCPCAGSSVTRPLVALAAALCGLAAGCAEDAEEPGPRTAAKPAPLAFPAELEPACERIARSETATVLCPPVADGRAALRVVHEDLDPDPCSYVINISARAPAAGEPAYPVLGGSCEPLPLQARRNSYALVRNERGGGYVLSLRWRSSEAGRAPSRRQVAVLQELAGRIRAVQG